MRSIRLNALYTNLVLAAVALLGGCGSGSGAADEATHSAANTEAPTAAQIKAAPSPLAQQVALTRWSAPISLSLVPASGAVLANGKVLLWSADGDFTFNASGITRSTLFDPMTNSASAHDVTETSHTMFCPGTARLPDGRLLVNGGIDDGRTSIYDPLTNRWSAAATMNIPRAYEGSVPLADGSVFTLGGGWRTGTGSKDAEVFTIAGGWRRLPGINDSAFYMNGVFNGWPSNAHYNLVPTGNGKVLFVGPAVDMKWIDTSGNGSYSAAGPRGDDSVAFGGNTVMFDTGLILKAGGNTSNAGTPSSANAYLIDTRTGDALVSKLPSMTYPRLYSNSVVLPGGQVVVIGGQTVAKEFSDDFGVLAPELFDPQSNTWTVMPAMSVVRNYHSIAMLLPDGRVVSAGGGLCGCAADHPNLQIMSPPYLFNADGSAAARPAITAAPATIGYGTSATITTDAPVAAFSLIRLGAVTHTVNNDQRRVALNFSAIDSTHYQVSLPTNPGILLPGQWMLFAINANGTPSIARVVTVDNSTTPVLTNPGSISAQTGQAVNLPITATTPSGSLSFSASGLPAGLSINSLSGTISGTTTTAGRFTVTIRASNGAQTVSTDMILDVTSVATGTGLLGQYYNNTNVGGAPVLQRIEAPNFDWGAGSPAAAVSADNFSARWLGWIEAPASGTATLKTITDDGIRVWVGGTLVIDNWTPHAPTENTATIATIAGTRYPVMIEYSEYGGGATMQLQWQLPGSAAFVPVPVARLYPAAAAAQTNLASAGTASQSSTLLGGVAARAIDGNSDGVFANNSVTHTVYDTKQWWQVDLGRLAGIDLVQLWGRTDCCGYGPTNFTVFVSASDMTGKTFDQLSADATVLKRSVGDSNISPIIGIPIGAQARFVRVQLNGIGLLSLAEVQVFGADSTIYRTPMMQPIANQQTDVGAAASLRAVATDPDGNPLIYSASGVPPGVSIDASTGTFTGAPTVAGAYTVTAVAANAGGKSASTSFNWTVLGALPTITAIAAPVSASGASVSYAPTISSGAGVAYSWNFGDVTGETAFSSSAAISHTFALPGVYTVTLTMRTADGRTTAQRFLQAIVPLGGAGALARASSSVLIEARGGLSERIWSVNADNDSVTVFDAVTRARLAEVAVGAAPRTLARAADGRIWVVNRDAATISIINPTNLAVAQTVALPRASQPFGIVFNPSDGSAVVALQALGQLVKLNGSSGAQLGIIAVGDGPRHLALNPAGTQLLASRFITRPLPGEGSAQVSTVDGGGAKLGGEVLVLDPATLAIRRTVVLGHSERVDSENQGRGIPNYLGAAAIAPNGASAWVPSKQDNIKRGVLRDGNNLNFQNTVRSISSAIDLTTATEDLAGRVDHDNAGVASAAIYHGTGAYVFVALETNQQVAVLDPVGKRELLRFEVGHAPQGLALSGDGLTLYVNNMIGRSVSVIDLKPLLQSGQLGAPTIVTLNAIGSDKLAPNVLIGKRLFYDARDPRLSRDSYLSCAGCHNDGGHDGRIWDFTGIGEGLRNTIALRGRAGPGQGFMHWSANFDEVQDFEGQIRSLAGGTGLMSNADFNAGTRSQPLGDRKAGLSSDLDALAAYVSSLINFAPSPYRNGDGTLTAAATLGKAVFAASNCAGCHGGTGFTVSADASKLSDIGTIKPSSGKRLGSPLTGIDVPTLRDVWSSAPYLHDGSAATLGDAVRAHKNLSLSVGDLANIVEFVRQIGSEEPAPGATVNASPFFGASGGTLFTDPVATGQALYAVAIRAGSWLDGIQGLAMPADLPARGGQGGGLGYAIWPADEYLVRIYGSWGSGGSIAQLAFATNTGRLLGPFGVGYGQGTLTNFDYTVPAGNRIVGFTGRSGAYLNAIGVLYGP